MIKSHQIICIEFYSNHPYYPMFTRNRQKPFKNGKNNPKNKFNLPIVYYKWSTCRLNAVNEPIISINDFNLYYVTSLTNRNHSDFEVRCLLNKRKSDKQLCGNAIRIQKCITGRFIGCRIIGGFVW